MARQKQFERALNKLMRRRTAWLSSAIGRKRPGPLPLFNKATVQPQIRRLSQIARKILTDKRARKEFSRGVHGKRQWRVKGKGYGVDAKRQSFKHWYDQKIGNLNCVYIFWAGRKCRYVGRTLKGKGRPLYHFEKYWFRSVTRVDVYPVWKPTMVPMLECLAMDMFDPSKNKNSAAKHKYAKKCPVCATENQIKNELKRIFRLR
jgi:hypothetical protein